MSYTIVFTPPFEQKKMYIEASMLYSNYEPSYLLTTDGSSKPHITIVQFASERLETAYRVWAFLCEKMQEENFISFRPQFIGIAFIDGVGPYQDTTWIELIAKRGNEDSPLMTVHYNALQALSKFNLNPLNAVGSDYRPHLTLARIIMPKQLSICPKSLYQNSSAFSLEFGCSDEKWQYTHTLDTFPKKMIVSATQS